MANTVNTKIILNGPRNVVLHVYMKSDGASGELTNEVILTPEEVGLETTDRFRLRYIAYNFGGFDAVLEFDAGGITPNFKWVMTEGANTPIDFLPFSNIADDSGMDGNGNLMISTTGFTASQDQGSMLLLVLKP